ncbi:MAG TPA: DUF3300 domain-containing protein [Opitutaceae bacterium]|nr:DUF3300 domain-containing protein [Opitutaceae bacterium]
MKTLLSVLLGIGLAMTAWADDSNSIGTPKRTPEELQKLLAPIAIYPDALIAIILPAAAAPSDVVLAARYLAANGDPNKLDQQEWDPSVVALAHYPELVKWMDENLAWTREVGEAFALQPTDVMSTVQTLRSEAQQKGLLADTPQQKVIVRESEIYIEPASPDVIYVPFYDPDVFFIASRPYGPWLTFSTGFVVGSWLSYDCDWHRRCVNVYHHPPGWVYRPGWRWHDHEHGRYVRGTQWRPGPAFYRRDFPRADHPRVTRHVDYPRWNHTPGAHSGAAHPRSPNHGEAARGRDQRWRPESRSTATPPAAGTQTWGPSVANRAVAPAPAATTATPANPAQTPARRPSLTPEQRQNWRRDHPVSPGGASNASPGGSSAPVSAPPASQTPGVQVRGVQRTPPASVASTAPRPERIGSITPREGARPIVRQPDSVARQPMRNTAPVHSAAPAARSSAPLQSSPPVRASAPAVQRGDNPPSHGAGRNRDR